MQATETIEIQPEPAVIDISNVDQHQILDANANISSKLPKSSGYHSTNMMDQQMIDPNPNAYNPFETPELPSAIRIARTNIDHQAHESGANMSSELPSVSDNLRTVVEQQASIPSLSNVTLELANISEVTRKVRDRRIGPKTTSTPLGRIGPIGKKIEDVFFLLYIICVTYLVKSQILNQFWSVIQFNFLMF